MKPEIKQKWVDALRSGKYKQGQSYLKNTPLDCKKPRYCCLGVLMEINNCQFVHYLVPTKSQCKKLGIPYWNGENTVDQNNITETLANMNDDGVSFKKIAKYIEENL